MDICPAKNRLCPSKNRLDRTIAGKLFRALDIRFSMMLFAQYIFRVFYAVLLANKATSQQHAPNHKALTLRQTHKCIPPPWFKGGGGGGCNPSFGFCYHLGC